MSDSLSHRLPSIPGYILTEQLYIGSRTVGYRAMAIGETRLIETNVSEPGTADYPVVIKVLRSPQPSITELVQFRNHYAIAHQFNHSAIAQPLALERYNGGYALIFPDENLISLTDYWQQTQEHTLSEVLAIALQLTDALHYLSQQRVIHKDVKPANILIHPETKQVKLTNFGIASLLPKEQAQLVNPNVLEGTLAYMSPEQTGRMNRGIDYRTDYYSLGVTLYELLVGELPFPTTDPMELVHCHLANPVVFPAESCHTVPKMIQAIIVKLMAKNAEDGYQSAQGLKHDLEYCQQQWETTASIPTFELRFFISEKLYGRETEVQLLLDAFDRVAQGSSELMLVSGFSGIGKTAVVNEIHKPITQRHGYFIQGKFDQFNRNIPFSAFVQAFRSLVGQLLGESAQVLTLWKAKILKAVGRNSQVVLDVIPELKHIIGEQPLAPELSGTAAQHRFDLVFSQFVQVFTAPEHPLVIFLDDLQWVDPASLNLLKLLITKKNVASRYFLVIGAYRDNEILSSHPLTLTLDEMIQQDAPVNRLTLNPLTQADINQLVADTLICSLDIAEPLAQLVYQKAQGNPFFTIQFLIGLDSNGYILFNSDQGHWQCNLAQVQQLALTEDVVDYMIERLQTLPMTTQGILQTAACIGNQFDLATLAMVCGMNQEQVSTTLWSALQDGLVIPEGNTYKFFQWNSQTHIEQISEISVGRSFQKFLEPYLKATDLASLTIRYHFLHDRVQQAAYRLIPENQIQQVHLAIGRHWFQDVPSELQADHLFDIIGQLNLGRQLITDNTERQTLIQLNLKAAKQAIANTAYAAASNCLQVCRELLSTQRWQNHYDLTLDIYNTSVEVAYLQGFWEEMETLTLLIEQQVQNIVDVAKAYEFKIEARTIQGKFSEAISLGLRILASLGVEFPEQIDDKNLKDYFQETKQLLVGRSAIEILNLPRITSLYNRAVLRLLVKIGTAAYNLHPSLYSLISLKMVQLTLTHGNLPEATLGYLRYGMLNCSVLGDIETGYSFGRAALQLIEQFDTSGHTANTIWLAHNFIIPYKEPVKNTLAPLQKAYTMGLETGELACAGYAAYAYCTHAYLAGQELTSLESEIERYNRAIIAINQKNALCYNQMLHQAVLNLLGLSISPVQLVGKAFNEISDFDQFEQNQDQLGLLCFYIHKLMLCYLFQEYGEALNCQQQAQKLVESGIGTINTFPVFFWGVLTCLILLRQHPQSLNVDVSQLERTITLGKEKLRFWASHNPHYYQHKYALLCAESHRLDGDRLAALEAYDQAIAGAKANGYLQDEALTNELAAQFYLDWGKEKIAATYLQDAYTCYAEWGAKAKTEDLEQRYPKFLKTFFQSSGMAINPLETLSSIASSKISNYSSLTSNSRSDTINQVFDFSSVLKAAQTLTETIHLDELLQNLSQVILQNSGCDRLILVLPNTQGDWEVRNSATPEAVDIRTKPLEHNPDVPVKLIHYVKNTRELVYSDRLETNFPTIDDYLLEQHPKSFLCAPLVTQDELTGIVYLHSSTTCRLISSDRIVTLNFLFSQVAIGLKNAQVFEESLALKAKVIESSEQALRDSQARIQRMTENIPGMIYRYVLHPDGTHGLSYVSSQVREIYELEPEKVLQDVSYLQERIHPDDRAHTEAISKESAETLQPLKVEHRLVLPEKGIRWIQAVARPEQLDNGDIVWDGLALDITDRKVAEIALQDSQARFQRITDNVPGMIHRYVLHADGSDGLTYVDSQVREIFEVEPEVALHNVISLWERVHPDDIPQVSAKVRDSAETLQPFTSEHRLLLPQKGLRWIQIFSRPERLDNGDVIWDGVVIDISDRKQADAQLRQTLAQLEASNNELESFAYSISHDLRAPLRAINGFSQALLEDYGHLFNEAGQDYFARILANTNRMSQLIDDLLQLSRLSRSELRYTTVNLSSIAQEVLRDLQVSEPDERQVEIIVQSGATVVADTALMQVVMMNLLQNAWKFTSHHPTARIEFGVLPSDSSTSSAPIYFVKDDGAGFDMAYSHKLFGVFQRLHSVSEFPGTGIGLASVRRAIHRHGGQVWIEAAVEQGTTVFFTIPAEPGDTSFETD